LWLSGQVNIITQGHRTFDSPYAQRRLPKKTSGDPNASGADNGMKRALSGDAAEAARPGTRN
jgi:hypothetical protein